METENKINETIAIQPPKRSINFFIRRLVAFMFNSVFVIILAPCVYLIIMALYALLMLTFDDLQKTIAQVFLSPLFFLIIFTVAILLILSFKTCHGRQTPGNRYMGLTVVDENNNYLSFSKSLLRSVLWILSFLPFCIGIIWAVFNTSDKGWHDLILGTRIASIRPEKEIMIPKSAFISFVLGALSIIFLTYPIITMAGLTSSLKLVWYSFYALAVAIPLAFSLGVYSRILYRKKEAAIWGKNLGRNGTQMSLIAGVVFILIAIAIPSNRTIVYLNNEIQCEKDIQEIGKAVEEYVRAKTSYPESLNDVVISGYLSIVPTFAYNREYIYKVNNDSGKEYFVVECPEPQALLKGRGLLPPLKCLEVKYVQNKGLVVKTKPK